MPLPRAPQPEVSIDLLVDHPEAVEPLARQFYVQWPQYSVSVDAQAALLRSRGNRDRIPLVLVARRGSAVLGTVSLLTRSVSSHSHLMPWVAALYVMPQARHAGVAMQLVSAAEQWAARLGHDTVYIGISAAEEQYRRRGWNSLGVGLAGESSVYVLSKSLVRPLASQAIPFPGKTLNGKS